MSFLAHTDARIDAATSDRIRPHADAAVTRARLQRLIADMERRGPKSAAVPREARDTGRPCTALEVFPDAVRRETAEGVCTYREVRYPLAFEVGEVPLTELAQVDGDLLDLLAPREELSEATLGDLWFLDIETTGLGGAGTLVFLVATARIESDEAGSAVVLRQYLAESPPEEAALLGALIEDGRFAEDPVLVTYNGRSFDAPMLDERATMHRRRAGLQGLRHLDLLHPTRLAFRGLLPSCRLGMVESEVLRMQRPFEDIPGAEVPAWYFRFLRVGDARMLRPIVEHNELDVIGMTGLLAWLAMGVQQQVAPSNDRAARDVLAVGRLLSARGRTTEAVRHLECSIRLGSGERRESVPVLEQGLLLLATIHKRDKQREQAAALWHRVLELPTRALLGPLLELAMYYEHERREFDVAIEMAERAREHIERWLQPRDPVRGGRALIEIEHRLLRLRSRSERARGC